MGSVRCRQCNGRGHVPDPRALPGILGGNKPCPRCRGAGAVVGEAPDGRGWCGLVVLAAAGVGVAALAALAQAAAVLT